MQSVQLTACNCDRAIGVFPLEPHRLCPRRSIRTLLSGNLSLDDSARLFPVSFLSNLLLCPLGVGCQNVPQAKETYWFIMAPGERFEIARWENG